MRPSAANAQTTIVPTAYSAVVIPASRAADSDSLATPAVTPHQ